MKKHYLLLINLLACGSFAQTTYDSDGILTKAIEFSRQGSYAEAVRTLEELNISDPYYLIGQYELVNAYLMSEEPEKGLNISTRLFNNKKYEEYPPLLTLHGIALSTNDKLDEALEIFELAQKKYPESTNILFNKAVVYQKQHNLQAAMDIYRKIIEIDPSHTSALYNLGVIALEDGKIVHGSLALMTYLMVDPVGAQAKNALLILNKKYHQNYNKKPVLDYGRGQNDFRELEELLMAQVQFHQNFNLKISVDDVATRNMQAILDYLEQYEVKGDDFYAQRFAVPLKKITVNGQKTNYMYTTLLSLGDVLEKDLSKNKKAIESYIENYLQNEIVPAYYTVAKGKDRYRVFRESQEKAFVKIKPDDPDFKEGLSYSESIFGYKTGESNFKNNLLNGTRKYFSYTGNLTNEEHYKDDKLDGVNKEYFSNKILKGEYNYVNGALAGAYKTYFPTSAVNCSGDYNNNLYNGKAECFFPNGSKRLTANYTQGNFHGDYESYNETGHLVFKGHYVDNEINGDVNEFYNNRQPKRSAKFDKGRPLSDTYYFIDGKKASEYEYKDGKLVTVTGFRPDGSLLSKTFYDAKERKQEHQDYNRNNEVYQIDYFKNGAFEKSEYKLPGIVYAGGSIQKNYNAIGKLISEGSYTKELMTGEWNYYYPYGVLRSKSFYDEKGNITKAEGYAFNGALSYKADYKDNAYYGKYETFHNNKLARLNYYNEKGLNGPEITYYPTGAVHENSFYIDNLQSNYEYTYTLGGKEALKYYYINGILMNMTSYLASKPSEFSFEGKTGVFDVAITSVTSVKYELKNGIKNGTQVFYSGNVVLKKENYINDLYHGKQEYFNVLGNKTMETNVVNGIPHGIQTSYDELGNKQTSGENIDGMTEGKLQHFYPNGNPYSVITYEQDIKHGPQTLYDFNGNKIAELMYYEGMLVSYSFNDQKGNEVVKDVTDGNIELVSYHKNGNKALELHFKNFLYDGHYNFFFENGKPALEMNFTDGIQTAAENTYYANGNIYCKKQYKDGAIDNVATYYYENGDKALDIEYAHDLLHGNYIIYENNKIKKTAKYDSDFLVEI